MTMYYLTSRKRCGGFGLMGWQLITIAAIVGVLVIAVGFYEARKTYWDSKVREMCKKDGGVTVYEHVTLSDADYKRLGGIQGGLPVTVLEDAKQDYPYFREVVESKIHDWNPEVVRLETTVKRRSDGKPLGKSVYYFRRGGDIPSGLFHDSSFSCPSQSGLSNQIFRISGAAK